MAKPPKTQLTLFPPPEKKTEPTITTSWFDNHTVTELHDSIKDAYLNPAHRAMIVPLSGGKDSRAVAQLVWFMLRSLDPQQRTKPVYILAADTKVEVPSIAETLDTTLRLMQEAALKEELPITTHKVVPLTADTYWVRLLGYRYAAPTLYFRWCVNRLKINPMLEAIKALNSRHGQAITLLGLRGAESATRNTRLANTLIENTTYLTNPANPQNLLMAPINRLTNDDVWTYLLQVKCPWDSKSNLELFTLYRNATGECPVVLEVGTTSCAANSRFGCMTCTVINRNRSLEAMIDNGDDYLQPILDLRDFLAETTIPENKLKYRSTVGRDGKTKAKRDGSPMPRSYFVSTCKTIFKMLLDAQIVLQQEGPDPTAELITLEEIQEIRRINRDEWNDNSPDWPAEVWLSTGRPPLPPIPDPLPELQQQLQLQLWDDILEPDDDSEQIQQDSSAPLTF